MKNIFKRVIQYIIAIIVGIWDFIFFFFGMPYEEQAKKFKVDEMDSTIRGHENEKTTHQFFRANKVGKES